MSCWPIWEDTEMASFFTKLILRLVAAVAFILVPMMAMADTGVTLNTTPMDIGIGAQYNGLSLKVNGTVPAGCDVSLRFTGAPGELHLREKGKVLGVLWMNIGTVTIKNAPKVCIVDTSRPLSQLGDEAFAYGLHGVIKSIEIEESVTAGGIDIEKELLQLKENEGLYRESGEKIVLGPDQDGKRTFSAELEIPSALAPGNYHVEAIAVRDGRVTGRGETSVSAELIGFPAWLSKLAFERSLLYGIMATVIAIISGLAIGLVFQSKGAH